MTLVGVGVAIAVTLAVGTAATRAALGGDVVSVLTYTSNWHFLDTGQSYGELFERRSAFQHYWSLSIEEQLFLVLPVLLAVGPCVLVDVVAAPAVGRARGRREWSSASCRWLSPSPDAVYFGTQTRLLEFLAGAALGGERHDLVLAPPRPEYATVGRRAGWAGLQPQRSWSTLVAVDRESAWLYEGGIHLFALPVVAVIAGHRRSASRG